MTTENNAPQLPNYFELFQNILSPFTAKAGEGMVGNAASMLKASLDPKEIAKKKREMEVVLMWLKAQVGVVELSIKTLEYQLALVEKFGNRADQTDNDKAGKSAIPSLEELAKMASEMNPAAWAMKMMQEATAAKPVAAGAEVKAKKARKR